MLQGDVRGRNKQLGVSIEDVDERRMEGERSESDMLSAACVCDSCIRVSDMVA